MGLDDGPACHVASMKPHMIPGAGPVEGRVFLAVSNRAVSWDRGLVVMDNLVVERVLSRVLVGEEGISACGRQGPRRRWCTAASALHCGRPHCPPPTPRQRMPSSLIATEGVFWSYAFVVFTRNGLPSGDPLGAYCCPYTIHLLFPAPVLPGVLDQLKSTSPLLSIAADGVHLVEAARGADLEFIAQGIARGIVLAEHRLPRCLERLRHCLTR